MVGSGMASLTPQNKPHLSTEPVTFVIEALGLTVGGGKELALDLLSRLPQFPGRRFVLFVPDLPDYRSLAASNVRCICCAGPRNVVSRSSALERTLPRICAEHHADALLCLGNFAPGSAPCPTAVLIQNAYLAYQEPVAEKRLSLRERLIVAYGRHALRKFGQCARVIVQTPVMRKRLLSVPGCSLDPLRIAVIPNPCASSTIVFSRSGFDKPRAPLGEELAHVASRASGSPGNMTVKNHARRHASANPKFQRPCPDGVRPFTFLCLTRYYAHKNLEVLPEAVIELASLTSQPFKCIITISPDQHPNAARLLRRIRKEGLGQILVNEGPVGRDALSRAYCAADALILPTLLESCTRTYSEAMRYNLPILTSDRDFAYYLCGDAALYFDPLHPASIAKNMAAIMANHELRRQLTANGRRILAALPGWDEVAAQFVAVLEQTAEESYPPSMTRMMLPNRQRDRSKSHL